MLVRPPTGAKNRIQPIPGDPRLGGDDFLDRHGDQRVVPHVPLVLDSVRDVQVSAHLLAGIGGQGDPLDVLFPGMVDAIMEYSGRPGRTQRSSWTWGTRAFLPARSMVTGFLKPMPIFTQRWPRTSSARMWQSTVRTQAGPDVRTYLPPLGTRQDHRSTAIIVSI